MNKEAESSRSPASPANPGRRDALAAGVQAAAMLALPAVLPAWPSAARAQVSPADAAGAFLQLSRFLTGKDDLDPAIAGRTLQAFTETDPSFGQRLAALDAACRAAREAGTLPGMEAFDASPVGQDAALKATAVAIVSAWYLGYVGNGPGAKLIAYHEALMYRPTEGITTIPSYQLGGHGYWIAKPPASAA